jgi:ribonuclease R
LDKVDLTKRLGLKPDARNLVREALRAHEQAGRIVPTSGGRYGLPATQGLIEGTYVAHEGGFGFVIVPDSESPDIFIPERHAANALHRDKVLVRLRKPRGEEDRRPGHHKKKKDKNAPKPRGHDPLPGEKLEGEIVRILVRANPTLVGTVQRDARSRHLLLTPDETRISRPVQVLPLPGTHLPDARELQNKKVLVRLLEWDSPWDPLKGELLEVLGDASDPEVALQALIRKYRLPLEFPDDVQAEANRIPARIPEKEAKRRLDLREEFIFTIDPETARDFDDAIHIHRGKNGEGYEVGIHIADVSNYVYPGTALDREARVRGNSTYLVDRVIPMIPERLSNGICSLVPNEDRLTRTVLLKADGKGRVISAKFAETVINSKVRLTYPQALGLLEKPDGTKISDAVNLAWEFAGKVRQRRFANGALDLDFPDVSVILDDAGHPVELRREENDISHQLIEEFMLLANEAVAKATREHSLASVYRVHNEPDEEKLAEFRMVLQSYGFSVGDLTQRKELQKFLSQLRGHSEESALKVALLKSLKRALYDTKPEGHYGLAKADYTHFTSPIRRYADLVVHRVLLKLIEKKPSQRQSTLSAGQMGKIAEHISETERVATEAERESKKLKQLEYLKRVIEEAPKGTTPRFQAVVTDIRGFGAFVELPDMLISGLLRQQDLRDWGYYPDSGRGGFVERRTDKLLRIGSEITVEVMDIDLLRKQVNFMLVSEEGKASGGKASAKSRERGQKRGYRR